MIALGIGWYRPHSNFVHELMQFPFIHALILILGYMPSKQLQDMFVLLFIFEMKSSCQLSID